MKTLRSIVLFILAFVLLLVVVSLFLPSKVHVERSTMITAPPAAIFSQVNNLHNWSTWMPWNKIDPNMKIDYFGSAEGKGSGYLWTSENKNVGNGKLTITDSKPDEYVATSMEFQGRGEGKADFKIEPTMGGSKVTWGMDSETGMNPFMKYMGLFMDQMIGGMFEKGLDDLKKASENNPVPGTDVVPADSTQHSNDSMKAA